MNTKMKQIEDDRKANGLLPLTLRNSSKHWQVNPLYYRSLGTDVVTQYFENGIDVYDRVTMASYELRDRWIDVPVDADEAFWRK